MLTAVTDLAVTPHGSPVSGSNLSLSGGTTGGSGSISSSPTSPVSPSFSGGLASKAGHLGGILTAIMDFSRRNVGGAVTYIECDHVAISLSTAINLKLTCACFHQIADGEQFGALISRQLLGTFITLYRPLLDNLHVTRQDMFGAFNTKIVQTLTASVQTILDNLTAVDGVTLAVVIELDGYSDSGLGMMGMGMIGGAGRNRSVGRDRLTVSSPPHAPSVVADPLLLLSTHDALFNQSLDVMAAVNDRPTSMTFSTDTTRIFVTRFDSERATLIVHYKVTADDRAIRRKIDQSTALIKRILQMADDIKT